MILKRFQKSRIKIKLEPNSRRDDRPKVARKIRPPGRKHLGPILEGLFRLRGDAPFAAQSLARAEFDSVIGQPVPQVFA